MVLGKEIANHKKSKTHILNHKKKIREEGEEEVECKVCGETLLRKNMGEHRTTIKHMEAQKKKFGEKECHVCKEKFIKGYWKEHTKTKTHLLVYQQDHEKNIREKGELEVKCKVCGETLLRKNMGEHRATIKHMEAQKEKVGEEECDVCKEKFIKGFWKEHAKTETHLQIQEMKKVVGNSRKMVHGRELYTLRLAGSEENQQYINTLTTFLAVRYALTTDQSFVISVNDDEWNEFGDIVIMFDSKESKIEAIQCKKVETDNGYSTLALSAESGKLSLREQCEILKKVREKNKNKIKNLVQKEKMGELTNEDKRDLDNGNENFLKLKKLVEKEYAGLLTQEEKQELEEIEQKSYENVNFRLFTVSSVSFDHNPQYDYTDTILNTWKNDAYKQQWRNRSVEIKQSKNKKKDLFNTTDDADNICTFRVLNHQDDNLNNDLEKFRLYINQKKRTNLQMLIKQLIEYKFGVTCDISDDLIKYIRRFFKTDKIRKLNERNFKLTREDVLLKISELLLAPLWVVPQHVLKEENLEFWNKTVHTFDVTVMEYNEDILEKVYRGLMYILKQKINYTSDTFDRVIINVNTIGDEKLKLHLFRYDKSFQFLYFALWKSGSAPLVLNGDNANDVKLICTVSSFLKSTNFYLSVIVTTNFKITHNCFPKKLKVFLTMGDLKILSKECLEQILDLEIMVLDSKMSLKQIESSNDNFLEKLTPDALLNIYLNDFSFIDVLVPMTRDIIDDTLVFNDNDISKIERYFQNRDETGREESNERELLTYLVSLEEVPSYIQVPPEL